MAIVGFLSAGIAATEVLVFRFMGGLVDWLARSDRANFFAAHGHDLLVMGAVVLVLMPVMQIGWQLTFNQGLFGNFPMMGRWRMHRYLLRQSLAFFQDDMAGRIANTVMQTALAVRETITKVIDLAVYIGVYFIGSVLLMLSADWRLTIPMLLWLAAYIGIGIYFVPRMQKISEQQADARSIMTGRIVDSYSNIMTVKLFAHSTGEVDFARQSMDEFMVTAYGQARLTTRMNMSLFMMNYALLVAMVALCINLWMASAHHPGRGRHRHRPGAAAPGHEPVDPVGDQPVLREHRHREQRRGDPVAAADRRRRTGGRGLARHARARSASTTSASTTAARTGCWRTST